ncbi:MAG: HAMP domain-containing sensor histidine kinase, partial [Lachnospiraceae bacterium]|nr:HAMP domain-containing sensor histidine kinase [Lachnospiraceae bacterium]
DASIFIETIINDLDILAQKSGTELIIKEQKALTWFCDPFWMKEVIENILKNCIEHCPNGKVELKYTEENGMNHIVIVDNGTGFSDGRETRVFERYSFSDRTKEGSSGLGLSIAQQAMKLHFGTITASNMPDQGTCFRISFPQLDSKNIYRI